MSGGHVHPALPEWVSDLSRNRQGWIKACNEQMARAEVAEAALSTVRAAVLALHRPVFDNEYSDEFAGPYCSTCTPIIVRWPCATAQAVGAVLADAAGATR